MSVTAQEIFDITMDLIDQRLETGLISESDTKSYNVKTPSLLTLLQTELIKQGDIFSTFEISNKAIENMLGYNSNFDIQEFDGGDDLEREANGSVEAYYFEVDAPCTVYIEDYNGSWNTLATITDTTATSFTAYKGTVTPSSGATKSRLRFTGSYYFRTINRAMFSIPFQSNRVPDYRPWIKKTMPSDFKSVDEIINEYPQRQYKKDANFKWEGRKDLYVNYYYEGNIRIIYRSIPNAITALTDVMEVDDLTARTIIPYGLGAHLMISENPDVASYFQQRFEELKAFATLQQPASEELITNLYGDFNG